MTILSSSGLSANNGNNPPDIQILGLAAPIRHALQGMSALAARPSRSAGSADVARALRLPAAALSKSFQRLAKRGLLLSRRGPGGGYKLAREPQKITLAEIAAALEVEDLRRGRCLLEERDCTGSEPCPLHRAASEADARLRRELAKLTLADLAAAAKARRRLP